MVKWKQKKINKMRKKVTKRVCNLGTSEIETQNAISSQTRGDRTILNPNGDHYGKSAQGLDPGDTVSLETSGTATGGAFNLNYFSHAGNLGDNLGTVPKGTSASASGRALKPNIANGSGTLK